MPPIPQAVEFCTRNHASGRIVIVVTARMYQWEDLTKEWLRKHLAVPYVGPFMRGDSDFRPDYDVKKDIYRILVEDHGYQVVGACDDNPNVIRLWTELGIPVETIPGWFEHSDT